VRLARSVDMEGLHSVAKKTLWVGYVTNADSGGTRQNHHNGRIVSVSK
jgi:hypothetical protein